MTGLMTIFLIIGAVGFLFLLLSLMIGDLFDWLGFDFGLDTSHDFGIFDSRVIAVFLTAFGGFGIIATTLGYGAAAASIAGLFGGVIFGAVVFYFGKLLYRQQSSSSVTDNDLLGRTAQVTVMIRPDGVGQISCLLGEERVEKIARTFSGQALKPGQIVRIDAISGDSVIVSLDGEKGASLFLEKS